MNIDIFALLDPLAFVVVLAGTSLATIARCGFGDIAQAVSGFLRLLAPGFNEDANRAALARCAPEIRQRGHLSANPAMPPDKSLAKLVDIYRISGSIGTLRQAAKTDCNRRETSRTRAISVFEFAAELAPVFGLVGTLFAITQLSQATEDSGATVMLGSVATAVLSSLYGVLTAHLICGPISGAIERRGKREEAARTRLLDFFEGEVTADQQRNSVSSNTENRKRRRYRDAA